MSERTLFLAALEKEPAERAAFLDDACAGDPALRQRLEALLRSHEEAGSLLQAPADDDGDTVAYARKLQAEEPVTGWGEGVGSRVGPYKLVQQIGEGGIGYVFLAQQEQPVRRLVALKIIKPGMDSKQVIARFLAERQALALMDHPNIAKVLDAGTVGQAFQPDSSVACQAGKPELQGGRPFFVMELVKGVPITTFCDEHHLTPRQRLELFVPVCAAVQHAHTKGVIHRDLKPSNVLVALYDGVAVPKIIDFGVAKATGQQLTDRTLVTGFGAVVGTLEYMSPEQAQLNQLDVDTRSDIYSLGVILYELLTGTTPLERRRVRETSLLEVLRLVREEEPPRPSTRLSTTAGLPAIAANRGLEPSKLRGLIRGELDWIVLKCLEKERNRRYETASGLAMDLRRYLRDEPVLACPPSAGYRLRKLAARHKAGLLLAATAVVLLLAATLGATLAAFRERDLARQTAAALRQEQEAHAAAEEAAQRENAHRRRAEELLERQYVAQAVHLLEEGDCYGALPWIVEGLRLAQGDQQRERMHRYRLGAALQHRPRFVHVWFHGGPVLHAEFSRDGARVVTACLDGTARVYEAATGEPVSPPLRHGAGVTWASFSPDGLLVVTACKDGTAQVWETGTGRRAAPPLRHGADVTCARFSPDGRRVVIAGYPAAWVWDVDTGRLIATLEHITNVNHAAFSPDGKLVVTASKDNTARVWEAATGKPVTGSLKHSADVTHAAFQPDGQVVTASSDGTVREWDVATGMSCGPPRRHACTVWCVACSPDGSQLLTACGDGTARLWAPTRPAATVLKHARLVYHASFSPRGARLATASWDRTAQVWDSAGRALLATPPKHDGPVRRVAFSPNGLLLATASLDHTARVWDAVSGEPVTPLLRHKDEVWEVSFSPDGRLLLTASRDGTARVWDSATGKELTPPLCHGGRLLSAEFSPDGARVVTAGDDGTARLWDAPSGQPLTTLKQSGPVNHASFSPDGLRLVTTCQKAARIWDVASGQPIGEPLRHRGWIPGARFSPDGQRVVTFSTDSTARVWEAATGQPVTPPLKHDSRVLHAEFSPDGDRVVTASMDHTARVWDAATGASLSPPLRHESNLWHATFSPDGARVVTTADDARVWELPYEDRPLADLLLMAQVLSGLEMRSSGQFVPLDVRRFRADWAALRARYPRDFPALPAE